ncbi:MAG: hypothetical protein Q8M24_23450 [Pseudolabrys sp.]|nr:hypothetical protein [Pseudolabrys sp.]
MTKKPAEEFDFEGDAADDEADGPAVLLTKRELASVSGWPPKQIDSYVRAGMPTVLGETSRAPIRFELKAVFRWFVEFTAATADPMAELKKRKAVIALSREERRDREEAGEFYPRAAVHREIDEAMVALRNDLLTIPASLVDQPPDVRAAVKVAIVAKINALSFEHGGNDGPQT